MSSDVCMMESCMSDVFVLRVLKLSVTLRTLPSPCWEHHKPRNVTYSGSVEKQGKEKAAAFFCLALFLFYFFNCSALGVREPKTVVFV